MGLEPIDPVAPCPRGGWPKAALRVELAHGLSPEEAIYALACLARRGHIGFVAAFGGRDLYAYPHQTTSEIWRGWKRCQDMERAGFLVAPGAPPAHWTPRRKAGLVFAVAEGLVQRLDVLTRYAISEEEFAGWETRFAQFGLDGLAASKIQALATPPAAAAEAAA